jgi:hypothetical protein
MMRSYPVLEPPTAFSRTPFNGSAAFSHGPRCISNFLANPTFAAVSFSGSRTANR